MTDIEGILARYGIDIRETPDKASMVALYNTVERLEEHCFSMQQDIRRLYALIEQSANADEDFTPGAI
jgi:FPC/CPF motif-containing protein YcgG